MLLTDLPSQLGRLSSQFVKHTLIKLPVICDSDKISITNKWLQAQSFVMGPTCLLHTLLPQSVKLHCASLILATLALRVPQPLHLWTFLVTDHECHTLLYMPGYLIKKWVNQLLLGLPATELLLYLKKRLEANLKVPHSLCVWPTLHLSTIPLPLLFCWSWLSTLCCLLFVSASFTPSPV